MDPRLLIEHADFVRSVVRRLVPDREFARDVEQETWLRAFARPPRHGSALRGWLAKVTRSVAFNQLRAARRRRARRPAPKEVISDPAELVGRMELRNLVAEEVLALEEPGRTTLLLRYYEGLSTHEVAQHFRIPVATVRTRTHRALRSLRTRLGVRLKDQGQHLGVLSLLALRVRRPGPVVSAGGILAMKHVVVSVSAVLVALVAWLTVSSWPVDRAEHERARPVDPGLAPDADVVADADRSVGREAAEPKPAPVPDRYLGSFRGRLLLPNGGVAVGYRVVLLDVDPVEMLTEKLERLGRTAPKRPFLGQRRARTDDSGVFVLRRVPVRSRFILKAGVGSESPTTVVVKRAPAPGSTTDLGDIALLETGSLTGRVVGPDGHPVPEATVRIVRREGNNLAFPDFITGLRLDLLDPAGYVAWKARDTYQVARLPGWVAQLCRALSLPEARTDDDGRFRFVGVQAERNLVVAGKPGFVGSFHPGTRCPPGATKDMGDLRLQAGKSLTLQVVDAVGRPLEGAEVLCGPTSFRGRGVHLLREVGTTDGSGRCVVAGTTGRTVLVAVRAPGSGGWVASGPHSWQPKIEITVPVNVRLKVRVRPEREVRDVEIRTLPGVVSGEWLALGTPAPLDVAWSVGTDGAFAGSVPPGTYTVLVSAVDRVVGYAVVEAVADTEVEVSLAPASALKVEVQDVAGAPVVGAALYFRPLEPPPWSRSALPSTFAWRRWEQLPLAATRTGKQGRAVVPGLSHGPGELHVRHPGHSSAVVRVELPTGPLRVVLDPNGGVVGRILRGGKPVTKPRTIRIEARNSDVPEAVRTLRTDRQGEFEVQGLSAGTYELTTTTDRAHSSAFEAVYAMTIMKMHTNRTFKLFRVEPGRVAEVVLEEEHHRAVPGEPSLTVFGRLVRDGEPAAGLEVFVMNLDSARGAGKRTRGKAKTGADGGYRVEGLRLPGEAGRLMIMVRDPELGVRLRSEFIPIPERAREFRWDRHFETGDLDGRVVSDEGEPLACTIGIHGPGSARTRAGQDGAFRVRGLPVGSYRVQALTGDKNTVVTVKIGPGRNRTKIVLVGYAELSGRVDLREISTPPEGAAISVVLVMKDGAKNYRPMARVNRASGRYRATRLMAGVYQVYVHVADRWFLHPDEIRIEGGSRATLDVRPRPHQAPGLGPKPPRDDRTPGRPMTGPEPRKGG